MAAGLEHMDVRLGHSAVMQMNRTVCSAPPVAASSESSESSAVGERTAVVVAVEEVASRGF